MEAAFDRYSRAILSGVEPTAGLFIESLEAEGISLSLEPRRGPSRNRGPEAGVDDRPDPVPAGLVSRQIRGLS